MIINRSKTSMNSMNSIISFSFLFFSLIDVIKLNSHILTMKGLIWSNKYDTEMYIKY